MVYLDRVEAKTELRGYLGVASTLAARLGVGAPHAMASLGLQADATAADMRRAFAQRVRALHPDTGGNGDGEATWRRSLPPVMPP